MFDNHTFARVVADDRAGLIERAKALFAEDGCGGMFVRDEHDATITSLQLHGRRLVNGWGVPHSEIEEWADKIMSEKKFRAYMAA